MRVERHYIDSDLNRQTAVLRLMTTTCPNCKKFVQFTLQDEEFMNEENKFLVKQNEKLRKEILRLNQIINKILGEIP